ncbi:MAG: hypothetical protein IJK41_02595 [Muribaculaceae bacterium]|nr:hypothetical protein [Muribaculaceae bacterium]
MNRKKALIILAIIEGLLNILLIVLLVIGKLSVTGFLISFGIVTLLTMLAIFIIIKKTQ